ncbi:MAG: hypothetical protein AB8C84_05790 [Oligoflexales bacterium]
MFKKYIFYFYMFWFSPVAIGADASSALADVHYVDLLECAAEMIEDQYDEGESVRVGLEYLFLTVDTRTSYEAAANSCAKRLQDFRGIESPRGAHFEFLKNLSQKDVRYTEVLQLLSFQRKKLQVQSVTRRGCTFGLGLALTCGYQTKIMKTPLGRRYKSRRALFPLHTGIGFAAYKYEEPEDIRAGDYHFHVSRQGFLEKKCLRPRPEGAMASHFREKPYEVASPWGFGYGSFCKQRSEHSDSRTLFMVKIPSDFRQVSNLLMNFVKRGSRASTMSSDIDILESCSRL